MSLDNVDKKLLYLLDQNCRQSTTQLAKQLRIHRNVVLYRIKRLEDTHIIRGYYTDIDTAKMGYTTFRILLNLSNYSKEDEEELTKFLLSVPQLIWFFKTEGKYDMDIVYVSKSVTEFYSFIDQLHIRFNRLIADEKIGTLIQLLYYGKDYLINKKREKMPIKNFNSEVVDIDENDKKIFNFDNLFSKTELIKMIQKMEGNFDCFSTAYSGECDQADCCWRNDCYAAATI